MASLNWYLVYTAPKAEKKADQRLREMGVNTYLPLRKTLKQWSDRKKLVEEPVFKSYLFVQTDLGNYHDILNIPGIVKFIRFGGELAIVREDQIQYIKLLLSNFEDIDITTESIELEQRVEIIAGPLKGLRGIVTSWKGTRMFAVEIEHVQSSILVNIPEHYLRPIEQ